MDVFDLDEGQLSICLSVTDCLNGLNEFLRKFLRSPTKQDLSVFHLLLFKNLIH